MNETILIEHAKQINEATSALIEMEGMKARNELVKLQGNIPEYDFGDFDRLLEKYELGYNGCIIKSQKFQ
jgi:hypothetical protein